MTPELVQEVKPLPATQLLDRALGTRLAAPLIWLVAALAIFINEWSHHSVESQRGERTQLLMARINGMEALQLLTNAESAQRGYLLTGREHYLEPYKATVQAMPEHLNPALDYLLAAGGDVALSGQELRTLIEQKLGELAATLDLYQRGLPEQALELLRSDIGKEGMDRVHEKLGKAFELASERDRKLAAQISAQSSLRRWVLNLVALLAGWAAWSYARRLALEQQQQVLTQRRLEEEVQARTADLRELSINLQTVQEAERARLSRELHDEMGSLLTATKFELLRLRKASDEAQRGERLQQVAQRLDEIVAIKRRIIEDLRPSALQHLGLTNALELLCREVGERTGLQIELRLQGLRLADEAEITLYRLVQEALTNVQKYAKAQRVEVQLQAQGGELLLQVADDGQGFDTRAPRVARHGLAGMRHRVEALGGQFELHSAPGQGTQVRARLPLPQLQPAG